MVIQQENRNMTVRVEALLLIFALFSFVLKVTGKLKIGSVVKPSCDSI